jgi:PAS domain S-box-containing protein
MSRPCRAAALVRVSQTSQTLPGGANALWVAVLVAVVARQILVVADNESLRHGLERRVQERTSQLRSLASERERTLESVADGIYGVDLEGRVTFINAAAAHTLGASAADLVGREAHATFHTQAGDDAARLPERCHITQALREGITATAEQDVYRRLDGKEVPVEVTASPLRDDGAIRGAVVAFRDVTERREMERIKDEFVSVVSHELRTPLTAIRGALGLLDSGALEGSPEQAARMARIALTSSERLSRLVDDILDMERLDAGTTRLELAEHRVNTLVAMAVDQVSVQAEEAGVVLIPTGSLEVVRADGERIVQTLTNLLGNAVKFSPRGGTVRVTAVLVGDLVELRVDDEGRGIPPDKLEAVFGRFEQVDASDTRERGGSGLGLAIARSIVERHGGRLWAVSEGEGRGSSFRFTLRRVTPRGTRGAVQPSQDTSTGTSATRVVVVDDDPDVVHVLRRVLEGRGYDVVGVTDVQAALEAIGAEHPTAIVLDLAVPGASGSEALARLIRRRPHQNRVLVVEDDDDLRRVVATVLESGGLAVTQASSVAEARDAIARGDEPDLVVLDLVLPGGTGYEFVADLRRAGRLRQVPLVVYSAAEVDTEERARLRLGRTVFLTKGRTAPDAVLDFVLDLLDTSAGRADDADGSLDLPSSRT